MRRRLIWMLLLTAPLIIVMSCGDDDDPPSGVSFAASEESTTESDGTLTSFHPLLWQSYASATGVSGTTTGRDYNVKLLLDRPAAETSVISYSLSGTAIRNSAAAIGDYDVDGTTLTINKGESEANITLKLYEDFDFLEYETDDLFKTVIITLNTVVSGPATIDQANNVYTLTINEDDLFVLLQWNFDASGKKGPDLDTDMDLYLWNSTGTNGAYSFTGLLSAQEGIASDYSTGIGSEYISIPGGFPNGTYGMSYVYYSGSSETLRFKSYFVGTLDGTFYSWDNWKTFSQTYSQKNINATAQPLIVQKVSKNGLSFTSVTPIDLPQSGSRTNSSPASGDLGELKSIRTPLNKSITFPIH